MNIDVECINYDKFNQLISDLNESVETNKHVIKIVEGERGSITYLIQQMHRDLTKLKIKSDAVVDVDIQSEIIRLKDRVNNLETLLNSRFSRIEISIHELMKTLSQKFFIFFLFFMYPIIYISNNGMQENVLLN